MSRHRSRRFAFAGLALVAVLATAPPQPAGAVTGFPDHLAVVRDSGEHLQWIIRTEAGPGEAQVRLNYGVSGDAPVWGDWDGNGTRTPGLFRNGMWLLKNGLTGPDPDIRLAFGNYGDVPVVGDWNGDGRLGFGVFRSGRWLLRETLSEGVPERDFSYGAVTDVPVVGDWRAGGAAADGVGIFRGGLWKLRDTATAGVADITFTFGEAGDIAMVGDWNGDGVDGIGAFRAGVWHLRATASPGGGDRPLPSYGSSTDVPVYANRISRIPVPSVTAIDWSSLSNPDPTDADSLLMASILRNTNRYANLTWWHAKGYAAQAGVYLRLGGVGEQQIRPAASEALALAVSLRTGVYDPGTAGASAAQARDRAVRLVCSLAYRHLTGSYGGWGNSWQSALWAAYGGFAGWLLWDNLTLGDRQAVSRMVEHEANRLRTHTVLYRRDSAGTIIRGGDTAAEENAWNAMTLQLATAMMPQHASAPSWRLKSIELLMSAWARPIDVNSAVTMHGRPGGDWLNGSNVNPDGVVVNHGKVNPDYSTAVTLSTFGTLAYSLVRQPTARAALFRVEYVYDALVDKTWSPGTPYEGIAVRAPGGTAYVDGSPSVYYPHGTDWGTARYIQFMLLDVQARAYGFDSQVGQKGDYWQRLHGNAVLAQQARFTDGRTYGAAEEDRDPGREELVAVHAAQAYLTKWIVAQGVFSLHNNPV